MCRPRTVRTLASSRQASGSSTSVPAAHPVEYAITLRIWRDGRWRTIHLFDNAHGVEEHHEHRYVGERKQPPIVMKGTANFAMATAMNKLRTCWAELLDAWERTR